MATVGAGGGSGAGGAAGAASDGGSGGGASAGQNGSGGQGAGGTGPDMPGSVTPTDCRQRVIAPMPSLKVTPRILWRKEVAPNLAGVNGTVVLSGERLAITLGYSLFTFDRQGTPRGRWDNPSFAGLSEPVADPNGRFYVASDSARAFDGDARLIWTTPLRSDESHEGVVSTPFVSSPDGVLYSAQADRSLQALERATGKVLWKTSVADDTAVAGRTLYRPAFGHGDRLVVSSSTRASFYVFDRRTGKELFQVPRPPSTKRVLPYGMAGEHGFFAGEVLPTAIVVSAYDWDGVPRWSLPRPGDRDQRIDPRFVDLEGNVVAYDGRYGRAGEGATLRRFGCKGDERGSNKLLFGDGMSLVYMFALGADGALIAEPLRDADAGGNAFAVVGFDPEMKEIWRFKFEGLVPPAKGTASPLVLASDGVLYLIGQRPNGTAELIAIQTSSPGLAATAWPVIRVDNMGSGWAP